MKNTIVYYIAGYDLCLPSYRILYNSDITGRYKEINGKINVEIIKRRKVFKDKVIWVSENDIKFCEIEHFNCK